MRGFRRIFPAKVQRGWVVLLALAAVVFQPSAALSGGAAAAETPAEAVISRTDGELLFSRLDAMLAEVEEIMGLRALRPVERALLTRDEINRLVSDRVEEGTDPEEIRQEELFLHLFGFVPESFDLAAQVVDVLTEQATALYDYKTRKLYLATWTPKDMQEVALVHELAHALADQHFDLERFVSKGKSADSDLARSAVIEGQAAWVMTEWALKQAGRSMLDNRLYAVSAAGATRREVTNFPVYSSAPLYIRESLVFPYSSGLLFQQEALERFGQAAFGVVFRTPPESTRHILEPASYFAAGHSSDPKLPRLRLRGFKRTSRGDVGQLDHQILLEQYGGEGAAESLAGEWRGGRFEVWENRDRSRAALRYASEWASAQAAKRYFERYGEICLKKSASARILAREDDRIVGRSERGVFVIEVDGSAVSSIEGLPDDAAEPKLARLIARGN